MKMAKFLFIPFFLLKLSALVAQHDIPANIYKDFSAQKLKIAPAIGLNPYPTADLVISNLVQWDIKRRLSLTSYTAYTYNSVFLRDFNYIKTNYNYSLSQKIGVGTTLYSKRASHTFSLLGGIKYNSFKETLENPEFEKVSASASSISPDFGMLYHSQVGMKKFFFSYRMYLPLYPYPVQRLDITAIDGNIANLSLEFGLGVRLK
ncbi:MAG: hypothetical protein IPN76_15595 [Saprospiraceae bacterium]|nr:hypothetical protein [Saprospiraceae bacterium]